MDKSWEDHLEEMAFEFDVYLEEFRIGAALGPAKDQPFHDLLYAHEVAMIEFAKLKQVRLVGDGELCLTGFAQDAGIERRVDVAPGNHHRDLLAGHPVLFLH